MRAILLLIATTCAAFGQGTDEIDAAYKLCQQHIRWSSTTECSGSAPARCIRRQLGFDEGFENCAVIEQAWAKYLSDKQRDERKRVIDDLAGKLPKVQPR